MATDGDLVDQIVRGVLEELRTGTTTQGPREAKVPPATVVRKMLALTDRVITAELLERQCHGAGRLVVGRSAILTPSARDFLKRHDIDCERDGGETASGIGARSATDCQWKAILVRSTNVLEGVLAEAGRTSAAKWERELAGCERDAVERAVSAICRAEVDGVVVFASRPESIACRANRNPRVRAAAIASANAVKSMRQEMGANVYCVDPAGGSHVELRNILREVAAGGPPRPPEGWRD